MSNTIFICRTKEHRVSDQRRKRAENRTHLPTLTEVEWVIMDVVWDHHPCAAGTVQELLQDSYGWAYSTVKTTMDRMCAKGILTSHAVRNLQLFSPVLKQDEARIGEFRKFLKRAFDGAVEPMMQFLVDHEELSDAELDSVRELIRKSTRKRNPEK
jgi:BlaI family transcriptional regulator, penicillinase repressor